MRERAKKSLLLLLFVVLGTAIWGEAMRRQAVQASANKADETLNPLRSFDLPGTGIGADEAPESDYKAQLPKPAIKVLTDWGYLNLDDGKMKFHRSVVFGARYVMVNDRCLALETLSGRIVFKLSPWRYPSAPPKMTFASPQGAKRENMYGVKIEGDYYIMIDGYPALVSRGDASFVP